MKKLISEIIAKMDVIEAALRILLERDEIAREDFLVNNESTIRRLNLEIWELGSIETLSPEQRTLLATKRASIKYAIRFQEMLSEKPN